MDDWNWNEKSLGKWQYLQHYKSIIPQKKMHKEWQIMLGSHLVLVTQIPQFTISIEKDN